MEQKISDLVRQSIDGNTGSKVLYQLEWPSKRSFEPKLDNFKHYMSSLCSIIFSENIKRKEALTQYEETLEDYDTTVFGHSVCEKIIDNRLPIMVNMIFKYKGLNSEPLFGNNFIYKCTSLIQETIINLFEVSSNVKEVVCFYLCSDVWLTPEDNCENIEIRFHFPYTYVDLSYLNDTFLPTLVNEFATNNIISYCNITPINSISDIVIKQTEYIPILGGKTTQKKCALFYEKCMRYINYESINNSSENNSNYEINPYSNGISPQSNMLFTYNKLDPNIFDEYTEEDEDSYLYWLPLVLSVQYTKSFTKLIKGLVNQRVPSPTSVSCFEENNPDEEESTLSIMDQLLSFISKTRCNKECFYFDLGKAIHNICKGSKYGLEQWKRKVTDVELLNMCDEEYATFRDEFLDIRTIELFAKIDSPNDYKEWHSRWIENDLINSLEIDHVSSVKVLYKILRLDYIYDPSSATWYKFGENRLKRDLEALCFANDITDIVIPVYYELRKTYKDKLETENNPGAKKAHEETIKLTNSLIKKLKTGGYRTSIISMAKQKFKDENFTLYSDENLMTMSWKNGVTDCTTGKLDFKEGKLQDYITKSTRTYYPSHMDKHNPRYAFTMDYYSKVHRDPELRHHFLKDEASFFEGGNAEKLWRNWIGESNASKSQSVKYLQESFGEYCVDLPASAITVVKSGGSGAHDAAMEQCKGARLAIVAETSINEPLDATKIKRYTGNDRYWNRTLNDRGGSRVLSFKIIHMSNVIANIPDADEAFRVREVIYPFRSRWVPVKDAPQPESEQYRLGIFEMDEKFVKKIVKNAPAQIFIMAEYYTLYKKEGLRNLPLCVINVTQAHQQNNDPYYNFIKDKIMFIYLDKKHNYRDDSGTKDQTKILSVQQIYFHYKKWFENVYPRTPIVNQIVFGNEMKNKTRLGEIGNGNIWCGLTVRE